MKRSCCLDPLFYYTCSKRVFCTQQVCVIAPPAHVHLHDGAFLLIEAAGGTMHCIWPSRFLRCKHGGAFPFVSAFHSLSAQSNQSDISSEPNPQHFLENNQSMAVKKNSEHVHDEV